MMTTTVRNTSDRVPSGQSHGFLRVAVIVSPRTGDYDALPACLSTAVPEAVAEGDRNGE